MGRAGDRVDTRRVGIDAYLTTSKRSMTPRGPRNTQVIFGVEAEVWTVAAKKADQWYRGVLEAAERFMTKWHEIEAILSRNRHASTTGGPQGIRKGGVKVAGKPRLTRAGRRW